MSIGEAINQYRVLAEKVFSQYYPSGTLRPATQRWEQLQQALQSTVQEVTGNERMTDNQGGPNGCKT